MADERSELEADDLGSFGELERRVLALVEQLRERDTQIVVLKDELRSDGTRDAVKRRIEALLRKVAELEREG